MQGAKTEEGKWHPGSRIIGFDGKKTCWVINGGVPFCVATDQLRPCSAAETLAYQYMHKDYNKPPAGQQQSCVDYRSVKAEERQPDEESETAEAAEGLAVPDELTFRGSAAIETLQVKNEWKPMSTRLAHALDDIPKAKRARDELHEEITHVESRGRDDMRRDDPSASSTGHVESIAFSNGFRKRQPSRSRSRDPNEEMEQAGLGENASLREHFERTGTTGAGVNYLEKKARLTAMYSARDEEVTDELIAFIAERLQTRMGKKYASKNQKKEARGKTLNFERETYEVRTGLEASRGVEWSKWQLFQAGKPCRGKELQQLLEEGHEVIPTRRVDVDRNAHKRQTNGPEIAPEYKSRLTGRGDLEIIDGLRADSPTADIESHNLVFSFAASKMIAIKSADISNAYFQGKELDRILLLRPPKGGLPDPDYADGEAMILARVPIYGTADAGRRFWQRFREEIVGAGFREIQISKALYALEKDGKILAVMVTHVDDMMWAAMPEAEANIQKILDSFAVRKVETGKFRFCGKEVHQSDDFTVKVTCKDTAEQIDTIKYDAGKRRMTERATEGEATQL